MKLLRVRPAVVARDELAAGAQRTHNRRRLLIALARKARTEQSSVLLMRPNNVSVASADGTHPDVSLALRTRC